MQDLLARCSTQAVDFFEEAANLAEEKGYIVGPGNTYKKGKTTGEISRIYYAVRVEKDCGIVSFCEPNIIEFYFNRLCERGHLEENQAVDLYRYLQNEAKEFELRLAEGTRLRSEVARNLYQHLQGQGFEPDNNHRRGNVILLTELDDNAPMDRICKIYKEVLKRVAEHGCLRTSH